MDVVVNPENFGFALRNAWLIPILPFASFFLLGLFSRFLGNKLTAVVATGVVMTSALIACGAAVEYFSIYPVGAVHKAIIPTSFEWLRYQPGLSITAGIFIDPISLLVTVVATVVSSLVHLYSMGYMADDPGVRRYFTYLNFFTASMLGLVLAPNILQTFVCWELVGACSFLLIGFYFEKPSAAAAAKKAFIVTRFADLGFLIGVLLLGYYGFTGFPELGPAISAELASQGISNLQPFDYLFLNHPSAIESVHGLSVTLLGAGVLTWSALLIFMGAAGKSAMFPLHIWLPDAMEGPTPVSALIHAATMVVAGVYLVARLFPVFDAAGALPVVACIGAFTCLFAAVIACTQDDIKRILAFSTLSQLGYMMFALGVATMDAPLGYTASMFHLFTHAFFKALLFLGAGAVIHAVHSNDIWQMGGLAKKMPITNICILVATLAIAGVPPLAGFWSKDEILSAALHNHHPIVFATGLFVAGLTAFYMFRLYIVTFGGSARSDGAEKAHEAPLLMTLPLMILGVLSMVAGFVPMGDLVGLDSGSGHHGIDWFVASISTFVGLMGILTAYLLYAGDGKRADAAKAMIGVAYPVIKNKFYIDEIYLFVTHKIIFRFISTPIAWFDRHIVDGGVNLSGFATKSLGSVLTIWQTGQVQTYGLWMVNGAFVVLLLLWTLSQMA